MWETDHSKEKEETKANFEGPEESMTGASTVENLMKGLPADEMKW